MGFDYRELMTQVLAAQGEKQPCPGVSCGNETKEDDLGCELCSTTKPDKVQCPQCNTTKPGEESPCNQCSTTKQHADGSGSRYAQDLTFLRQQLRDAMAAG
jgi:hypothetical protein